MKLLTDAQLPRRLASALSVAGHDAVHTLDLPKRNATPDSEIRVLSMRERRIVVTKDGDFSDTFVLSGEPYKLLLVSTGNIRNRELEALMLTNLERLAHLFEHNDFARARPQRDRCP